MDNFQADYTLFTFSLQSAGNKMTLERSGSYCFDDIINKFIPGKWSTQ
jgi:hypothetical protein